MKRNNTFMSLIWCILFVTGCQSINHKVTNSTNPAKIITKELVNETSSDPGPNTIKVLYAGDSGILMGRHVISSPMNYENRGVQVSVWCRKVLDLLNSQPDIEVRYMTTWEALEKFPETPEALAEYDVVVLSDIEWEVLVLYPEARYMKAPMGPNRLESIREFVKNGGALAMIGGWTSFTGRKGAGGYHGTPVEQALPIECLEINDDRCEAPEGVHITTLEPGHPIMSGLKWETCPVFTGYNRIKAKPGTTIIAKVKEFNDPFLVVGNYGKGRTMAFASDLAPHWGAGFMEWHGYGKFWTQAIRWLGEKE
jgi:uncharacterized membrane protein